MDLLSLRAWVAVSLGVGDFFFIGCCDKYYIDSHQDAYFSAQEAGTQKPHETLIKLPSAKIVRHQRTGERAYRTRVGSNPQTFFRLLRPEESHSNLLI